MKMIRIGFKQILGPSITANKIRINVTGYWSFL